MKIKGKLIALILIPIALIVGYFILDNILFDGFRPREINEDGFQAKFFSKAEVKDKAAIIVIGGGPGGDYWGREFANRGWVNLSLPYYRQEGLPPLMEEIPLEYFERAISWLGKQPEVDRDKIIVMGASRNAELALVIGSKLPKLVSGVIAFAPGAVSWSNTVLPFNSEEMKPSWTYQGEDIPYLPMEKIKGTDSTQIETLQYWMDGLQKIEQYEEAVTRVENIKGPILLLSGKDDKIWPSALMSNMIEKRLQTNDFQFDFENVQFENAGHLISRNVATISSGRIGQMEVEGKNYELEFGGTIEGDKAAIIQSFDKILSFIQKLESQ